MSSKGGVAWDRAKANVEGLVSDATAKGQDAVDAVREVSDNMMGALDESLKKRPYTTLAIAVESGFSSASAAADPSSLNGRLARLSADGGESQDGNQRRRCNRAAFWPPPGAFGMLVWLSITLFIWLAERFDDLTLAGPVSPASTSS